MKIAIGADHGGFELKKSLMDHLSRSGHEVLDVGTHSAEAVDYPVFARKVAEAVATGQAQRGVMIDGAGIGSSMVANKVPGVRAAMAYDLSSARNGREHNDANLLTLGAGLIGGNLAAQIVDVFLTAECNEPRHRRRVAMIAEAPVGAGAAAVQVAAAVGQGRGTSLDDLSETDMARIIDRLEGLLGGGGDAWHGGPCVGSCPDTARRFIELGARRLTSGPDSPGNIPEDMARYIDHTILKPDATRDMVDRIVTEAREFSFRSVCVNPCWVTRVAEGLRGSGVLTCSVVGFPLGANTPDIKGMEARKAIRDGAKEIDMVINVGRLKSGDDDYVLKDILAVTEACRDGSAVSKVIIETALLTDDEKKRVCELAKRARANFVKTSTGFASGGATAEDVALMARVVRGAGMEVKASGGIKSFSDAKRMIEAGATRIGASASIAIVQEAHKWRSPHDRKEPSMVDLRAYCVIDSLQPQFASFQATVAQGFLPRVGQASLFVEIAPGIEINRVTDIALKSTNVTPGMQIVERHFGMLEVHSDSQADVRQAGQAILEALDLEQDQRLKPRIVSDQVVRHLDDHQCMLINRMRHGNLILSGQTLFVLECEPAAYAALAANEAEKAAGINILEVRAFGSFGRVYIGGEEKDVEVARPAAVAALEALKGREIKK